MIVQEQQNYDQKLAIKELNSISEGKTAFLQDWTTARIASCHKLSIHNDSPTLNCLDKKHEYASQRNINQIIQPRKTNTNFRMKNFAKSRNITQQKQEQIFAHKYKKFDNITVRRMTKENKSSQKMDKLKQKHQYMTITQFQHLKQKPIDVIKKVPEVKDSTHRQNQLNESNTFQYLLKLKNESMKYLKIQECRKSTIEENTTRENKSREQARRINQLIKNKIRRKRTNKFLVIKQINEGTIYDKDILRNHQSCQKIAIIKNGLQQNKSRSNQMKLLKNWLDTNRYKKKRSIGSLLREHLDTRSFEQHKEKQKTALAKSIKFLSLLINTNKNIQ